MQSAEANLAIRKTREVNMMKEKLKVGVFGGGRGLTMMNVLLDHPDARLVAVCDKYQPSLDKVSQMAKEKNADVATYTNFDDFIRHDMDAVVLANYAHEHALYAVKCLDAGKHVLSEVLPCGTIAQGVALIEAVEKSGLVYAYAENYCYMQHNFEMWYRIKHGDIGDICYAEGEYVHDCTAITPAITYGDPAHWRNKMSANFYCTHSLGPMLMSIGHRPVRVVGYELPDFGRSGTLPIFKGAGGLQMVTLDNGAVCRGLHGDLRREGARNYNYLYYGDSGMMESGRFDNSPLVNVYHEGEKYCEGTWEQFDPEPRVKLDIDYDKVGHMGSDYYPTHFFIEKILGRPEGFEWSIDVYQAVEMGICGILAHRSALRGNVPLDVPDLRDKTQRDAWRNDNETTNPDVPNAQLVPLSSLPTYPYDEEHFYSCVRRLWQDGKRLEKYPE